MEQPLLRSETVADVGTGSTSTINGSWSSESLSKWLDLPASSSSSSQDGFQVQPRTLRSSSNMLFTDNSLSMPSFYVPGAGTELAGAQSLNESFTMADMEQYHHDKYADDSIVKNETSTYQSTSNYSIQTNTHFSYDNSNNNLNRPQSVFLSRLDTQSIWPSASASVFPYSQTREGNSPFLSSEPSPPNSFPESGHSDEVYTHAIMLSPLHTSMRTGGSGDDQHLFLSPEHTHAHVHSGTPEQFVNMSDVSSLGGGVSGSDFASASDEYSNHSPLSASYETAEATAADGTISFLSLNNNDDDGDVGVTGATGRKRKRNLSEDDSCSSPKSHSKTSAKKARVGTGRARGRPRKSTVSSVSAVDEAGPSAYPVAIDATADISEGEEDVQNEDDGDDAAYREEDDDGDDDSDAYVPSRSASPRVYKARRGSVDSGSSAGRRRGVRAPGSAAQALKVMEAMTGGRDSDVGPGTSSVFGYGEVSLHSGGTLSNWDSGTVGNGRSRSQPVPVPNLSKKSRGRKVPVDQSTVTTRTASAGSIGGFGGVEDYGAGLSLDGINEGDDSAYYQHPSQMQYGSETSDSSSATYGDLGLGLATSAPQHGRPARGRYSSRAPSIAGPSDGSTTTYGPGAKVVSGGIKKANGERRYVCTAEGCGKCFVRGEHLKRHVRSLHTWDKPHKCPHPGCNKSFSRRDNLGQHVRVHM